MNEDTLEVPSREDLKGIITKGAGRDLDAGDYGWKDVKYDHGKIDSTFDSYEGRFGEKLDDYSGDHPSELPVEAQKFLSTAISYASTYADQGKETPIDLEESSEEFRDLMHLSAALEGMPPVASGGLHVEEHTDLFGEDPYDFETEAAE